MSVVIVFYVQIQRDSNRILKYSVTWEDINYLYPVLIYTIFAFYRILTMYEIETVFLFWIDCYYKFTGHIVDVLVISSW